MTNIHRIETDCDPVPGCFEEFGPHDEHSDCARIMGEMSNPSEMDDSYLYDDDPMGYNSDSYIAYLNR